MACTKHVAFLVALFFLISNAAAKLASPLSSIKGGYWPTWTSAAVPSAVDFSYYTHVYYAFVQIDPATSHLTLTPDDPARLRSFVAAVHASRPPVKALLSLGGAGKVASSNFAAVAGDPAARAAFINSSIAVARAYGLDGLDLDWEYPKSPQEMADLGALCAEWRAAVTREAEDGCPSRPPPLLLTAAVRYAAYVLGDIPAPYPAAAMAAALDWINVMSYDLHGAWDAAATGAHAALFDPRSSLSASYGVVTWLAAGIPAEKVVLGVPLYGRSYNLTDAGNYSIGAPASGVGPWVDGVVVYSKVVEFNRNSCATVVHDEVTAATYSYAGKTWISYDDPWSLRRKATFGRRLGLGGYFFWAIGYDNDAEISRAARRMWG